MTVIEHLAAVSRIIVSPLGFLWRLLRHPTTPHEWSEPFTIGGESWWDGPIHNVVMKRTLRQCVKCGCTDAMAGRHCRS